MNRLRAAWLSYGNEYIKARRSPAFWLSFLAPLSIVGIFFLGYIIRHESAIAKAGQNPWTLFFSRNISNTAFLLLPFYIFLMTALIAQLEHRTQMWKQLSILPGGELIRFASKITFAMSLLALTMVFFVILLLLAGCLLGLLFPEMGFLQNRPDLLMLLSMVARLYVSTLGYLMIQLWLSLRIRNLIIPIGIGFAMFIAAQIMLQGFKAIVYFPYAYTTLEVLKKGDLTKSFPGIEHTLWYSVLFSLVVCIVAHFHLKRLRLR